MYQYRPDEIWTLSAREVVDLFEAHIEVTNEVMDREYQRTAWFTALLMNASGNMKKNIKPDKLYVPMEKQKKAKAVDVQKQYVEDQRNELMKKFNIE